MKVRSSLGVRRSIVLAGLAALALAPACSDDGGQGSPDGSAGGGDSALAEASPSEGGAKPDAGSSAARELLILHTNDLHGDLEGWSPVSDYTPLSKGDDDTYGGFARIAAEIAAEKAAAAGTPVLVLDAGDFMAGSIFDWLATRDGAELVLMQQMGYDAITLGNHEFDWSPAVLATLLSAAVKAGFTVPIVSSNLVFSSSDTSDDDLEKLVSSGVIREKLVKTLSNGLKVGIFGLVGKSGAADALGAPPVTFADAATSAQAMVDELKDTDKVDLVLCISHGGFSSDKELAKAVTGIDVIVGGHSHTALSTAVRVGSTLIVQAGSHGRYLGKLRVRVDAAGAVSEVAQGLVDIDDGIAGDSATQTAVEGYKKEIDALLSASGSSLTSSAPIAETAFDLESTAYQDTNLGDLVTDAYLSVVGALQPAEPPQIALESQGVIDEPILAGKTGLITLADLYRTNHFGISTAEEHGSPLVGFYLNGKDLKNGMEILALAESVLGSNDFYFQISGMTVEYSTSGALFDKVTKVTVGTPPVEVDLADTTTCYLMVTNLFVATQIAKVKQLSYGLLSIDPKEKDCSTVITDMTKRLVDADPAASGVQELPGWQAMATYLSGLPDTDGDKIPDVPSTYAKAQGRIVAK